MKKKFIRWCVKWFIIKMNLYLLWSRFHQWAFQRKRLPLPKFNDLAELEGYLVDKEWRADKWWMLWDVISHPEFAYNEAQTTGSLGDCDDWASFCGAILRDKFYYTEILSVQWLDEDGKFAGHNVCIFKENSLFSWIGNWYKGKTQHGFQDIRSIVNAIVGSGQLISWFTFNIDLKKINDFYLPQD